jgi:hypothetical protein
MNQSPSVDPKRVGVSSSIVAGSLVMAVVFFAGIALSQRLGKAPGEPMLTWVGVGFAALVIVPAIVVPRVMTNAGLARLESYEGDDAERALAGLYQSRVIVAQAMPEGAAFFNLVAYLLEGNWVSLGVVGGLLLMMLAQFPTQGRFENWVKRLREEQAFQR